MNSRLREIIKLLKNINVPMTSVQLSTVLNVSSKTVRNDIKELNSLTRKYNMQIEAYRGKGYLLHIKDEATFNRFLQDYIKEEAIMVPTEPDERVNYLIERILLQTDFLKIEDLAEELFVSRSTLQTDLKTVRAFLKQYELSIEHKPNYGIKVIGKESYIRFCISEFIFNQNPIQKEDHSHWLKILPEDELELIKHSILKNLRSHQIIISDISLQNLITHLAIACKRIQEDKPVKIVRDELNKIRNIKEFLVAKEIIQDIEAGLKVSFSENEVAYLTIHLQGTKLSKPVNEMEKVKAVVIGDEVYDLAVNMVKRIDAKYAFELSGDEDLLRNLSLHLKPAINRYRYQMNIRNPMLEEIKTKYPLSFEAALIGTDVIYEKMNITVNEDEIGYLALHIEVAQERLKKVKSHVSRCLIVCASGRGSAQLLSYKLKDRFGEDLDVLGTTEYYNLNYHCLENVDFIISTIPIQQELGVPVIYVSTILGDNDVTEVERKLTKGKSVFEQYMIERYTFLKRDFETPESVITFLGNILIKDQKAGSDYIDSVLEREGYAPTSFGNLIAIPHPLEPKTESTFWSIVTLNKPIQWGEQLVQAIFLLNTSKTKKDDLKPMFNSLGKLIDNKRTVFQLLECETYEQFKRVIVNTS